MSLQEKTSSSADDKIDPREMAYWNIYMNMNFLYGPEGFSEDSFPSFCEWLDKLFTNEKDH